MKRRIFRFFKNKFIMAGTIFVLWICFFNDIDLFYIIEERMHLRDLSKECEKLKAENETAVLALQDLTTNKKTLEKYARETYYMKRPNEVVFVFKERKEEE